MLTVTDHAAAEFDEKGSRFLAECIPYGRMNERLAELKALHPKASHHVTAFRVLEEGGRIREGSRDDGEPSGTAGMPILKLLQGRDLVNVGLIVVRYFGGVKLGTGGLARAYAASAARALDAAAPVPYRETAEARLFAPFAGSAELERLCAGLELEILGRDYDNKGVHLRVRGIKEAVARAAEAFPRGD